MSPDERFDEKWIPEPMSGCWLWVAGLDCGGYGRFGRTPAHRYSYEREWGRIPEGLQIDHLCRVRCCINPAHLRVVTAKENVMEDRSLCPGKLNSLKTHCHKGHSLADAYINRGWRVCRTCERKRTKPMSQARRDRLKAQAQP